jgi:hypothetical protein
VMQDLDRQSSVCRREHTGLGKTYARCAMKGRVLHDPHQSQGIGFTEKVTGPA